MVNEGFDREYIKEEVSRVIRAAVDSSMGEALATYIPQEIKHKVSTFLYDRIVQDAIKNAIGDVLQDQFVVRLRDPDGQ